MTDNTRQFTGAARAKEIQLRPVGTPETGPFERRDVARAESIGTLGSAERPLGIGFQPCLRHEIEHVSDPPLKRRATIHGPSGTDPTRGLTS
jgi:hypothetical protein